jgi:glycosyltransferase involved in cell wall biosynthesis
MGSGKLAVIGGFRKYPESAPHGTNHAAFTSCNGLARWGGFAGIDVFIEHANRASIIGHESIGLALPEGLPARAFELKELVFCLGQYDAIYAPGTAWLECVPYALRPIGDLCPIIGEIDCSHHKGTWQYLLHPGLCGMIRSSDGLIFKSEATRRVHQRVWNHWRETLGFSVPFPNSIVIANPIEADKNAQDPAIRRRTRSLLGLRDDQVVFLTFNRIEPFTKGDAFSLLVAWSEIVRTHPAAVLLMCGAQSGDRLYVESLRTLAREMGVANHFVLLENPFELFQMARNALMSAADVFLHLSTGVEESAPLTVLQAMAHGLPPVVANWSGMVEQVQEGITGFVVPLLTTAAPESQARLFWGLESAAGNVIGSQMAIVAPGALHECVRGLASNRELRARVGAAARNFILEQRQPREASIARAAFMRQLAREAHERGECTTSNYPVHIDHLVSGLAPGSELSIANVFRLSRTQPRPCLEKWIAARFIPAANAILHELETGRKRLLEIVARIETSFGEGRSTSLADDCHSELSHHLRFIILRLVAGGFIEIVASKSPPKNLEMKQNGTSRKDDGKSPVRQTKPLSLQFQ